MFKVKHKLYLGISDDTFIERTNDQCNLRYRPDFITPHVHSIFHRTESISYFGPMIWDIVP